MTRGLRLTRPLLAFDLETTGTLVREDRIVELGWSRLHPDGRREAGAWRIHPGRPIPPAASQIHGITDAMVADCPRFAELAEPIAACFRGCDLAGYNLARFDVPLLAAEFARVGQAFPAADTAILDAFIVFTREHPRDLAAAVRTYCGRSLEGAHSARVDAEAALDVLLAQVGGREDVAPDVASWHAFCQAPRAAAAARQDWVDSEGKLVWRPGGAVVAFGKHRGRPLAELVAEDPSYLDWVLRGSFQDDLKALVREALAGRPPTGPRPR